MFMMFAMTSDSVGEIIKEVKVAFSVTNAQASLMHSLPMLGIALSGLFLGFLADKLLGYRKAVMVGAVLMTAGHASMAAETPFFFYLGLALIRTD